MSALASPPSLMSSKVLKEQVNISCHAAKKMGIEDELIGRHVPYVNLHARL